VLLLLLESSQKIVGRLSGAGPVIDAREKTVELSRTNTDDCLPPASVAGFKAATASLRDEMFHYVRAQSSVPAEQSQSGTI
jgi:hypothetical protein